MSDKLPKGTYLFGKYLNTYFFEFEIDDIRILLSF